MHRKESYRMGAVLSFLLVALFSVTAADTSWPEIRTEHKPGVRWWWMGNSVDETNLTWNLEELSKAGIGSVEITPIYGIKGNEANEVGYLSPRWMQLLKHTQTEARRLHMQVDMNGATGWPFGGPQIDLKHAATKQFIRRYPVKALPGGRKALQTYVLLPEDKRQQPVSELQALLFVGSDGVREQIPLSLVKDTLLNYGAAQDGELFALFTGKTFQQVKRAAPGGQGYVMDHLSKDALTVFLKRYDEAFFASAVEMPNTFFNDSYEVYGADWSDGLLTEFKSRRGYDLADYLPEFLGLGEPAVCARVVCDYRETVSDMLLDNFTIPWTEWAHAHGAKTRNQAHGSPGQLLDLYAAMDIPECESFGSNKFDIPGLRFDNRRKESDSNPVTLKFASSAAHVSGKPLTSCESMTWLTEHFRTSLSQIKPEMDLLFLNGINRVFYHGSTYSPKDAAWPGWLFYASIEVNPSNSIFRDMQGLNEYAARVQSFLQAGKPDNEVLVYMPIYDIWQNYRKGNYVTFDIHKLSEKLPDFQKVIFKIRELGYDLDYISDAQIRQAVVSDKKVVTPGGKYKLILVPDCRVMPLETMQQLLRMTMEGATVAFLNRLPDEVPGLFQAESRKQELQNTVAQFRLFPRVSDYSGKPFEKGWVIYGSSLEDILEFAPCKCRKEALAATYGAGFIRRSMPDGAIYFTAQLTNREIDGWVSLGTPAKSVLIYNPLTGEKGKAKLRQNHGLPEVYFQIKPGESLIMRTFDSEEITGSEYPVFEGNKLDYQAATQVSTQAATPLATQAATRATTTNTVSSPKDKAQALYLNGDWNFRFTEGSPEIPGTFTMKGEPVSWTTLSVDSASVYMGTGRYSLKFKLPKKAADDWMLDFGLLCESAKVYINGQYAGLCWSLPFSLQVGAFLKPGKENTIDIDVTNLPANRIADYDRRGVKWRIFKEINFVDVLYQNTTYEGWPVMPSGLIQSPRLLPQYLKTE
jgi:hypothetical protein